MRLVQPPLGPVPVGAQVVRIEVGVRPPRVLVEDIHVPVLDDRLSGEQVVGLVAGVVRVPEGAQAERGRVDPEEQQPEGEGASHRRRTLARRTYATTAISSW
jgi:hypothetical protein